MIEALLTAVVLWAEARDDVRALVLVGSHARGSASPESDVDLVVVAREPADYLADTEWVGEFGQPASVDREEYGLVTSLRVRYAEGPEVEFGLTSLVWATPPRDPDTQRVLDAGHRVLYDPDGLLLPEG